jgi:MoxR-like ATPase
MVAKLPVLRPPAEVVFADELAKLGATDREPRPGGWILSPKAVRRFLIGDPASKIQRKFYGDDALVERAIVSLMGDQGLMLVGEPGTAKSMLAELLAAAVSGRSTLVVQGSAGTTEDHVRYGWNYALLLAEGPSERSLTPSPVLEAMRSGRIVRVEEITRCPPEIQDTLISIMSEKVIAIPELRDSVLATAGFNVIATANLRDRGVHEMSSALKRRFNFETIHPLSDSKLER